MILEIPVFWFLIIECARELAFCGQPYRAAPA
jgi:hypothetical protein